MTAHRPLILIADDESKIRRLVGASLEMAGFDVCTAADGREALELFERLPEKPDLIVLDLMMPAMDGLEVLGKLREKSAVPVIMLTAKDAAADKMAAFRLGTDDYLTKPFLLEELEARIHAVIRRTGRSGAAAGGSAASDERRNGPLVLVASKRAVSWRGRPIRLAETEFRLLETLMRRPGAVLTHEELLRVVWGPQAVGELNTLRVAVARLRKKLAEQDVDPSIVSSWSGVGYMLGDLTDFTDFDQA